MNHKDKASDRRKQYSLCRVHVQIAKEAAFRQDMSKSEREFGRKSRYERRRKLDSKQKGYGV